MMTNNYELLMEKCKREDTKELLIQCLDKAKIDNEQQVHSDFVDGFYLVGAMILIAIFVAWRINRWVI